MKKKTVFITFESPIRVDVVLGKQYTATDFKNNLLPDVYTPIRKDKSGFYICVNEAGGHVWIKPAEFVAEAK